MNTTVYARQVAPERQESPLFMGDEFFPDNIAVCGNLDYHSHKPKLFENVQNVLEQGELAEMLEHPEELVCWYKNATQAITEYLPATNGKKYSTNAIHALRCLVLDYLRCACSKKNEILCNVLSIVDGRPWEWSTIRGVCQGDWQEVFYPIDEWNTELLEEFEALYFNTGTEWIVQDDGNDPDDPEDITGYSVYCTGFSIDDVRNKIAEIACVNIESVRLYSFRGYKNIAEYVEV